MFWYYFKIPCSKHELDVRTYFLAVNKNAIRNTHNLVIADVLENKYTRHYKWVDNGLYNEFLLCDKMFFNGLKCNK